MSGGAAGRLPATPVLRGRAWSTARVLLSASRTSAAELRGRARRGGRRRSTRARRARARAGSSSGGRRRACGVRARGCAALRSRSAPDSWMPARPVAPPARRGERRDGEPDRAAGPAGTEAIAQVDGRHSSARRTGSGASCRCTARRRARCSSRSAPRCFPTARSAPPRPATIVDRDRSSRASSKRSARQGYATLVDELEDGLSAVGAPVRDGDGTVVAALTVSGATLRLPPARLTPARPLALEQAQALSSSLGRGA